MSAKEYARIMREELYRQNKSVLEVTDDLWLTIADNMEKFAEQAVEEYREKISEQLENLKRRYWFTIANTRDEKLDCAYQNVGNALDRAIEIVKSGGVAK